MWHDTKEIVSEPKTVPRCFSLYNLDHGHNPSNTSCDPWPPGQLGAGRLPYLRVCICVAHGKHCKFLGDKLVSLLWQYIFDSALAVQTRSQFSVLLQLWEQQQVLRS